MIKEAIVLAGGLGTRLRGLVDDRPKSMALINGKPFLEYWLAYLALQGIEHIIFSVGYKAEIIIDYFGNRYHHIPITYSLEHEPLGTGGAAALAIQYTKTPITLITNGDTYFPISLPLFEEFHVAHQADISIVLRHMNDTTRYGSIILDEKNAILQFKEKENKKQNGLINGGIYLLRNNIFDKFPPLAKFSLERDFFVPYISKQNIYGFVADDYFIDIGVPEDFLKAQQELPHLR